MVVAVTPGFWFCKQFARMGPHIRQAGQGTSLDAEGFLRVYFA